MNGTQLVLFDYDALDANTRTSLQQRAERIRQRNQIISQNIWENGEDFYEAQQELAQYRHGVFQQWAEMETGYSKSTVYNFISVYKKFNHPNFGQLNFAPSALYMLAAPSTPDDAVEEAMQRAENGDRITYTEAKEIVTRHKDVPMNGNELIPPERNLRSPLITNDLGSYRMLYHDTKQCETCGSLWSADLDYCPYCHITPEVRVHYAQKQETFYRLPAANHALSDDPDYDGDEWYTPLNYIEAARRVMGGIDLDPASCDEAQARICAKYYLTKQDDALRDDIQWCGRVWLNPPYSTPLIRYFVTKLIEQHEANHVTEAIILTNNSSDTGWFHDLLSRYPACFTRGRAQFWRADSVTFGARQGQTLFYLGDRLDAFFDVFSPIGQVVVRA